MGYEYLIVSLAAALAGIGTGLVGLSAAAAMVPLLIVLCSTFGGEHGAFMATAIAVATFFSLVSAQFANKVNGKAVGYVTGVILLVLGLSMSAINVLGR